MFNGYPSDSSFLLGSGVSHFFTTGTLTFKPTVFAGLWNLPPSNFALGRTFILLQRKMLYFCIIFQVLPKI